MKKISSLFTICLAVAGIGAIIAGCDKNKPYDLIVAEPQVHFVGAKSQSYAVRAAVVPVYNVNLGTTDVASADRTVTFKVVSPTGAVAGTQYTLGITGNTVTIPAGKATAVIPVQGIFAGFPIGRIDTLVFTLDQPSVSVAKFSDTVRLAIGDICVEGVGFTLASFVGAYNNTNETFNGGPYGPYGTTISVVTPLTATTGTITVTNLWDNGWGPITFTLDWTNPNAMTTAVVPQAAIPGSNAGDLNPAYAGQTIAVRAHAATGLGTFSSCYKNFTLNMQLGVTGVGYFAPLYQVKVAQ